MAADTRRGRVPVALVVVVTAVGFLGTLGSSSTSEARRAGAPRRAQLASQIEERRSQVADLDQEVRTERGAVALARRAAGTDTSQGADTDRLAVAAGTTEVKGRGLVVTLTDSERVAGPGEDASVYVVHDSDLQLVVNALAAAGATAIAVNGNRIAATSPIRRAGSTIVVNFRPLRGPYEVRAVGADPGRFAASDVAVRFKGWVKLFGLGFDVHPSTSVDVAAYTGRVGLSSATPVE